MIKRLVAVVLALLMLISAPASFAAERKSANAAEATAENAEAPAAEKTEKVEKGEISMNFSGADIAVLVKYVSEMTGKNFVLTDKVMGKVTILSPKKVSKEEAYKVFESILSVYGYSAIPAGDVIKIVPTSEAKTLGGTMEKSETIPPSVRDQMVTRLIPLSHISADNMVNTLKPLVPNTSYIAPYAQSNTVIIVDLSSNIERLNSIIEKLDVEGRETSITLLQLKHASAKDLTAKINSLVGREPGKPPPPPGEQGNVVLAEDRLNALIVVGNEMYVNKVKFIVAQLDVASPPGRQEIHVVNLHHANATDLTTVLNQILAGEQRRTAGQPQQDVASVTADRATNSIIITASQEQFVNIKKVLEGLDVQRRQVFVEAIIFEIRADKAKQFGIEWRSTANINNTGVQAIGGTNFGNINNVAADPLGAAAQTGLVVGAVNGTVTYGGVTFANVGALLTALQSDTDVNIISTPNLLTTDNEEAKLFVGQNVPFLQSSAQTTGGTPIVNVQRQDVGTVMKLTPSISDNKFVRLKIYTESSTVSPTQLAKAQDIITFKRTAETVVVVKDSQNIVIGGLIQDQNQDVENKVPFLGSIPLIGWLFKSVSSQVTKTNLLIFLTPHIIENSAEMEAVTGKNRELLEKIGGPKLESGKKPGHGIGPTSSLPMETPASNNEPVKNTQPQNAPEENGAAREEKSSGEPQPPVTNGSEHKD